MVKIGDIELGDFPLLLAPMEDVSDPPFRALCKKYGADVLYTEFISVEGLIRNATKSLQKLDIYEDERPVGIQIFGADIEHMKMAVRMTEKSNPDIIDINFGCPVKKVTCKGAGAGILKDIPKMVELSKAMVKETNLPITVKTRLGWDTNTMFIEDVAEQLQDVGVKALSIHGRTRSQMYKGEADWSLIGKIKENPRITMPIFGNGDVTDPRIALEKKEKYGVDGIMIGRAAIGNPWIFNEIKHYMATGEILPPPGIEERSDVCLEHFDRSIKWKGERLGILEMRRHYARYFKSIPNFKEYRMKLVTSMDQDEIRDSLKEIVAVFA
ncbi:MAG: tRNA-dihydrouridine synthase B [Patiriisocius sp.]